MDVDLPSPIRTDMTAFVPTMTSPSRSSLMGPARAWLAGTFVVAGFAVLYWPVITRLVNAWWTDDNYSHGFLIVPVAAYLTWERRARLLRTPLLPSLFWLVVGARRNLLVGGRVL